MNWLFLCFFSVDWTVGIGYHPRHTYTGCHQPLQDGIDPRQYRQKASQHREDTQSGMKNCPIFFLIKVDIWYLFDFIFGPVSDWDSQISGWGIFLLRTEPEERGECLSRMRTLSTLCPCLFWLTSLWAALIAPDVMFCSTALCQPLTEWHNLLVTCHLLIFLVLIRLNVLPARACRTSQIVPLVPSACACVSLSLHFSISLSAGVLTATQIHLSHSLRTSQYVTSPLAGHLTSGFSLARDCSQMSSFILNSWCETNQNLYKWSSTIRGVNWSELRM